MPQSKFCELSFDLVFFNIALLKELLKLGPFDVRRKLVILQILVDRRER